RNGTMVFSVLDAPDAPGALHRLINGGVDPSLVCSLLNLVMGQRLLAKSCLDCQRWRPATEEEIERLDLPPSGVEVVANEGCESCDGRGSKGRMIVTELVTMSPRLAAALEQGADVHGIREALGADFVSIDDGIRNHVLTGAVPVDVAMNHVGRRPELTGSLQAVASAATRDTQLSDPFERLGGTVSIMFTDIVGSTHLTSELGDNVWMEVLRQHDSLVHKQLEAWDGIAVKSVGDGFMAAFGSASAAVLCGVAIQESSTAMLLPDGTPLEVRVGIHAGEPVKDQGDLFGTTVNVAARVAAAAQPGEVLVSDLVRALVASTGRFRFGEPRPVELRGLEGSHLLYAIEAG
ncbi:MAG TPA: adenylate/guanylate cyclase domain-containing protein, partial [Acidimicrobiales bacterium]|nr:adenylate/guanylate cyclase domain-containing protein [Acidimicrobiales bacterium]